MPNLRWRVFAFHLLAYFFCTNRVLPSTIDCHLPFWHRIRLIIQHDDTYLPECWTETNIRRAGTICAFKLVGQIGSSFATIPSRYTIGLPVAAAYTERAPSPHHPVSYVSAVRCIPYGEL